MKASAIRHCLAELFSLLRVTGTTENLGFKSEVGGVGVGGVYQFLLIDWEDELG